jgi:hypothetical protein
MPSSNDFTLTNSQITAMSYIEGTFVITEGESSSPPPTFEQNDNTWTVNIAADRKNSSLVANLFNSKTGGANNEYTNASGDTSPEELNFYFGVVVTFNVKGTPIPVTIYLGQGHYVAHNNWWIGGNTVVNTGTPLLQVIDQDQVVETFEITGSGSYSMTLTPVS